MNESGDKNEELRKLALTITTRYFRDKGTSEEAFMRHLERVYNFLINGKT